MGYYDDLAHSQNPTQADTAGAWGGKLRTYVPGGDNDPNNPGRDTGNYVPGTSGSEEAVARYQGLANDWSTHQAPQIDDTQTAGYRSNANDSRNDQKGAIAALRNEAEGNAPSAAQGQLGSGLDTNLRNAAHAALVGGGGANRFSAGLTSGIAGDAAGAGAVNAGAAQGRAQEISQATSGLTQAQTQLRANDLTAQGMSQDQAFRQATLEAQQRQLNLQGQMGFEGLATGVNNAEMNAQLTQAQIAEGHANNQANVDLNSRIGGDKLTMTGVGVGAGAASAGLGAYGSMSGSGGGGTPYGDPAAGTDPSLSSDAGLKMNVQPLGAPGQYLTSPADAKQNITPIAGDLAQQQNPSQIGNGGVPLTDPNDPYNHVRNNATGSVYGWGTSGVAVDRDQALANGYASQSAPGMNTSQSSIDAANAGQTRFGQNQTIAMLQARAQGLAPSPAEIQLQQGLQSGLAQQQALAHSARGGVQNIAAAGQQAATSGADLSATTNQQAGILHAQGMADATQQLAQASAAQRASDLQAQGMSEDDALRRAQLEAGQNALSQQGQLGFEQAGFNQNAAEMQNQLGVQQLGEQTWQDQTAQDQAEKARVLGDATTAGKTAASVLALSDQNAKMNVQPLQLTSGAATKQNIQSAGASLFGAPQTPTAAPAGGTPAVDPAQSQGLYQPPAPQTFTPSQQNAMSAVDYASQMGPSAPQAPYADPVVGGAGGTYSVHQNTPIAPVGTSMFGAPQQHANGAPIGGGAMPTTMNAPIQTGGQQQFGGGTAQQFQVSPSQAPYMPHVPNGNMLFSDGRAKDVNGSESGAQREMVEELPIPAPPMREVSSAPRQYVAQAMPAPRPPFNERPSVSSEMLDALHPYAYTYKPGMGEDPSKQRFGIMAQDLEKTPMGKSVVVDTPGGKKIDVPQATGVQFAALADIHDRLQRRGI